MAFVREVDVIGALGRQRESSAAIRSFRGFIGVQNEYSRRMSTDLRLVAVGEITHEFLVPSYQRGYRWGPDEVRVLLDDIAAIRDTEDKDYCLQPIVVKKLPDGRFELVDGQQRLTTLYLLLLFMKAAGFKKNAPPFSLSYETRPESGEFLRKFDRNRKADNIDFFHLVNAFECIEAWFEKHGQQDEVVANEIYVRLHRRVKVIWYEAGAEVPSEKLFARLNVGRIPLTNAELIKALILRQDDATRPHRAIEIGLQWDAIERRLHDPGLWAFATNRSGSYHPTRIELLFESMVDTKGLDRLHTFHQFKERLDDGESAEDIWHTVLGRMELFQEWYEDRDLYHWIGYLIATGTDSELRTLIRDAEDVTKSAFRASLRARIVARLDLTSEAIDELDYEQDGAHCVRVLLLFNVESTRLLRDSFDRYPFHAHKAKRWSLEHIHAQNAESLVRKLQWQTWLREHLKVLRHLQGPGVVPAARDALVADLEANVDEPTKDSFAALSRRVVTMFEEADVELDLHGIANLALLPQEANSALNNAVFEVKRQRILGMDRDGSYIPICTRRVFLKYYTASGDQQLQFWSTQDREAYRDAMVGPDDGVLTPYVKSAT